MTEAIDSNGAAVIVAVDRQTLPMENDGDDETQSMSGDSESSFGSIDENFAFSCSYGRTFDAENESISLLNLSISPISANHDDEMVREVYGHADMRSYSDDGDEEERISLEEITAQINTPPLSHSKSAAKRLHLETIFEGVFLETPPKKRRCETWRIKTIREVTSEDRIRTYVREQQKAVERGGNVSTDSLCNLFDERIDIN